MPASQKFVVWDWNGTLLDDTELVRTCVNKALKDVGHPEMDMERFRALQIRPLRDFYKAAGLNEDEVLRALEIEGRIFDQEYEPLADHAPLREGAVDLLRRLSGHKVDNVIVSNHLTHQIARLLEKHNIRGFFGDIIAYAAHKRGHRTETKGDKLRVFIAERGLNTANAVIIGDTLEEIEIARELGMASIAITGGIHAEERLRGLSPDYVVHTIAEIGAILSEKGFVA
ncbi:MAG: HAD family hydrolase [Alphaproteobacteria bacterium]|nr:HAD family hydrolase [Alphaproteobacteria bacterium]